MRRVATDEQILKALEESRGHRESAAHALGISTRVLYTHLTKLKAKGSLKEGVYETLPAGHLVRGVSTLYGLEGDVRAQWVKTSVDLEQRTELLKAAVIEAFKDLRRVPLVSTPKRATDAMLTCYPMGDPHIGLYAWGEETGEDFDLKVAETNLIEATRRLVACTPPTFQALVVNLGDFFHADSLDNQTRQAHNKLDVDTRWTKVLRVGLRVMRAVIETALLKHQNVRVINEIGNHDEHTSQMLSLALAAMYELNPRVQFDESPARFHYHRFHSNFIGITHGDTVKPEKLGGIMATDRPADWGASRFRYWFTGHVHTQRLFELPGCTVESFRTLAARDAWNAGQGYRSGRDMQAIVLHKDFGEIERHRVDIAMVRP